MSRWIKTTLQKFQAESSRFIKFVYDSDIQNNQPLTWIKCRYEFDQIYVRTTNPSIVILKSEKSLLSMDNIYSVERKNSTDNVLYHFVCGSSSESFLSRYNQDFTLICE